MTACIKCGADKQDAEFALNRNMKSGRIRTCRSCVRSYNVAYYAANDDRIISAVKAYKTTDRGRAVKAKANRQRRLDHPDRDRANIAVSNALQSGALKRQPCWACGEWAEAHHPDYSAPLEVVWLCPPHHREVHAMARRAA